MTDKKNRISSHRCLFTDNLKGTMTVLGCIDIAAIEMYGRNENTDQIV